MHAKSRKKVNETIKYSCGISLIGAIATDVASTNIGHHVIIKFLPFKLD